MLNKTVVLLSGGLDSLVSIGYAIKDKAYDIKLALTFNYGQKSVNKEIEASQKISDYYNIKHEIIELNWLKKITKTALVSEKDVPKDSFLTQESANSVWVPNRNSLFLNIAASYCDSLDYDYIIYGANKDEGNTFSDNTEDFRAKLTEVFLYSTLKHPKIVAPLINYTKGDIVKIALDNNMPLDLIWSCYNLGEVHCGECESCYHLKEALIVNNCESYIDRLFIKNEN